MLCILLEFTIYACVQNKQSQLLLYFIVFGRELFFKRGMGFYDKLMKISLLVPVLFETVFTGSF